MTDKQKLKVALQALNSLKNALDGLLILSMKNPIFTYRTLKHLRERLDQILSELE